MIHIDRSISTTRRRVINSTRWGFCSLQRRSLVYFERFGLKYASIGLICSVKPKEEARGVGSKKKKREREKKPKANAGKLKREALCRGRSADSLRADIFVFMYLWDLRSPVPALSLSLSLRREWLKTNTRAAILRDSTGRSHGTKRTVNVEDVVIRAVNSRVIPYSAVNSAPRCVA